MTRRLAAALLCTAACGSPLGAFSTGSVALTVTDDGSSTNVAVQANLKAASGCPSLADTSATLNGTAQTLERAGGTVDVDACEQPGFDFSVPRADDARLEVGAAPDGDVIVTHAVHARSFSIGMATLTVSPGDTVAVNVNAAPADMLSETAVLVQNNAVVAMLPTVLRLAGTELDVTIPSGAPLGTFGLALTATGPLAVSRCKGFATCTATVQLLERFPISISQ